MVGKEKYLVYFRMGVIVFLTFELSIDLLNGASFIEAPDLTKWGLWITFITFVTGLFSCMPVQDFDSPETYRITKNKPVMAWKLFTICFETALLFEISVTIVFWSLLTNSLKLADLGWKRKTSLIMDHFFPLLALLIDYSMNC